MQFPFCFILICKILQFLVKSYWFRQLIIIFQKVDTLRLLKFYIMFCLLPRCQISVFLGSNSWTKFLGPMESLISKYLETKVLGQLSEFESVIVDHKTLIKFSESVFYQQVVILLFYRFLGHQIHPIKNVEFYY